MPTLPPELINNFSEREPLFIVQKVKPPVSEPAVAVVTCRPIRAYGDVETLTALKSRAASNLVPIAFARSINVL